MKSKAVTEKVMQGVFFIAACTSVLAVALILHLSFCKWQSCESEKLDL